MLWLASFVSRIGCRTPGSIVKQAVSSDFSNVSASVKGPSFGLHGIFTDCPPSWCAISLSLRVHKLPHVQNRWTNTSFRGPLLLCSVLLIVGNFLYGLVSMVLCSLLDCCVPTRSHDRHKPAFLKGTATCREKELALRVRSALKVLLHDRHKTLSPRLFPDGDALCHEWSREAGTRKTCNPTRRARVDRCCRLARGLLLRHKHRTIFSCCPTPPSPPAETVRQTVYIHEAALKVGRLLFSCALVRWAALHPLPRPIQALTYDAFWMVLVGRMLIGLGGARGVNRRYIADTIPIKDR